MRKGLDRVWRKCGERSQRGHVLDSPATKRLGHVSREHESILTKAFGCICAGISRVRPTSGNIYAGFYCRVSLIIEDPVAVRWKILTASC
jgi:hypothetical protein